MSWSEKRYDHTEGLRARFIVLFEAKFLDIGVVHRVDMDTGIYEGRSKPLDASMTIVAAGVVLVVKTVRAIMTIVVIATIVAIVIFVAIVTIVPLKTVVTIIRPPWLLLDLFGLKPGIEYKERVSG